MITYARSGGPPDNWQDCVVYDKATKRLVKNVVEVDTELGYVVVLCDKPKRKTLYLITKTIRGDFEIRIRRK